MMFFAISTRYDVLCPAVLVQSLRMMESLKDRRTPSSWESSSSSNSSKSSDRRWKPGNYHRRTRNMNISRPPLIRNLIMKVMSPWLLIIMHVWINCLRILRLLFGDFPVSPFEKADKAIFGHSTSKIHKGPCIRGEYLEGRVPCSHHQRAQDTSGAPLTQPHIKPESNSSSSPDDPELWNFTLEGIEELNGPAEGEFSRGLRPSPPGNHQMQTRSMTPQRESTTPGRPRVGDPAQGGPTYRHQAPGQDVPQYGNHHPNHPQGKPGCVFMCMFVYVRLFYVLNVCLIVVFSFAGQGFSPYRQGQYMKKRKLDTWKNRCSFSMF